MYKINYIISYLRNNFRKIYLIQFDCFFFFNSLTICISVPPTCNNNKYIYSVLEFILLIVANSNFAFFAHPPRAKFLPSTFLFSHLSFFPVVTSSSCSAHPTEFSRFLPSLMPSRQQLPLSHFHNRTTIIRKTKAVIWPS
jgi:hypothetical protein